MIPDPKSSMESSSEKNSTTSPSMKEVQLLVSFKPEESKWVILSREEEYER